MRASENADGDLTARYFGQGYYHLYRHYLLPAEQTQAEAAFLVRELGARAGQRWLDLPCGYGRHLAALAALRPKLRLAGGDLNFAYLREPGARRAAALTRCDMRRLPFASGAFHTVINLLNSFGYYPPARGKGRAAEPDDRAMLTEIARVLRPRGHLVLDLANRRALVALVKRQPVIRYLGGEYEVTERFAWDAAGEVLRNETLWRWPGGQERARYRLRLYTPGQTRAMLARAGFEILNVYGGFNRYPFDAAESDRMLIVARKKG